MHVHMATSSQSTVDATQSEMRNGEVEEEAEDAMEVTGPLRAGAVVEATGRTKAGARVE